MAIILPRQKCKLRGFPPAHLCGFVGSRRLRQMHKNCRQILYFTLLKQAKPLCSVRWRLFLLMETIIVYAF